VDAARDGLIVAGPVELAGIAVAGTGLVEIGFFFVEI
jgi:hypothetical protein